MKEYYRIVELNPPNLDTVDVLVKDYGATHLYTHTGRKDTYRHFIVRLSDDEIIVLKLKYGHMTFDQLTPVEQAVYRQDGYIR